MDDVLNGYCQEHACACLCLSPMTEADLMTREFLDKKCIDKKQPMVLPMMKANGVWSAWIITPLRKNSDGYCVTYLSSDGEVHMPGTWYEISRKYDFCGSFTMSYLMFVMYSKPSDSGIWLVDCLQRWMQTGCLKDGFMDIASCEKEQQRQLRQLWFPKSKKDEDEAILKMSHFHP